ncbi:MAG TPA: hypothetical protein VIF43_02830 [Patescibacteria group bacterium]|jgi:ABC-type Fe3+ transport system permease subunit
MIRRIANSLLLLSLAVPAGAQAALPQPDKNPREIHSLSGFGNLGEPVSAIFNILIVFLPTVALLYLIISGYRYMVSQGNQELVEKAKKSLLYAVFGFVVSLVSVTLIILVSRTLGFNSGL